MILSKREDIFIIIINMRDIFIIIINMRDIGNCLCSVQLISVMYLPRIVALTYGYLPILMIADAQDYL